MSMLETRWLVPVAILSSDRFLQQDILLTGGLTGYNFSEFRHILFDAVFDYESCCGTRLRDEDVDCAIQYWFDGKKANDPISYSLIKLSDVFLQWQGNCFEVRSELLSDWLGLCGFIEPAWIIATAYQQLFEDDIRVDNLDPLFELQCFLALPKSQMHKQFADNHVHLGGNGSVTVALLDIALYVDKKPKRGMKWPRRVEHLLFEAGTLDKNGLAIWLNAFAKAVVSGEHLPRANDFQMISVSSASHPNLLSDPLLRFVFDEDKAPTKRWLMFCLYTLTKTTSKTIHVDRSRLIRCSNIFRSYMMVSGVGLGQFVTSFGFSLRKSRTKSNGLDYLRHALSNDLESNVAREFRVSPNVTIKGNKLNHKELLKLASCLQVAEYGGQTHFVVHFTRGFVNGLDKADCAAYSYREKLLLEVRSFQKFFTSATYAEFPILNTKYLDLRKAIRGFDVAGNENQLPIEVYAPSLRVLRAGLTFPTKPFASSIPRPFLTIHAGEDYSHLLSGLRSIDEAVQFCTLENGDRLGHALALGVNVNNWVQSQRMVYISLADQVDNLAWLYHQAVLVCQISDRFTACLPIIKKKLSRYSSRLFGENYEPEVIYDAWFLRRNQPSKIANGPPIEKKYWQPDWSQISHASSEVVALWQLYLNRVHDPKSLHDEVIAIECAGGVADNWNPLLSVELISELELELYEAVQDFLLENYAKRGIVIEACPTSNITIGRFSSYQEHPIFRWNPPKSKWLENGERFNRYGIRKGPIAVCINTDDAGLMPTTLENEHRLIEVASINDLDVPALQATQWIDAIREKGNEVFQSNHLDWVDR